MLKNIAAGVPVIVSDQLGWSRATARRFDVGYLVDRRSTTRFARVLRTALEAGDDVPRSEALDRSMRFHSIGNFAAEGLVARAAKAAGRSRRAPTRQWSWVLEALPHQRQPLR